MVVFHRRALPHCYLILLSIGNGASSFNPRPSILLTKNVNSLYRRITSRQETLILWMNHRQIYKRAGLKAKLDKLTKIANNDDPTFVQALQSNNLDIILSYLQSNTSSIPSLSGAQLQLIFNAVETATAESDENTVNKRAIEDANIVSASLGGRDFRSLDHVRFQMTKLYRLLREEGKLNVFGAIGRPPPSSLSVTPSPEGPIYPTSGSKNLTPVLLEQITNMEMTNLTPQPTNLLFYGGVTLVLLEGISSLYFDTSFNHLVFCTLFLVILDQILVSGAVFEAGLRMVMPEMTTRITKHEAGHFLCAYLLGCPVEGVVLSTWAALNDGRFVGRSTRVVSAGMSYYDLDLSEQISGAKPLTQESIDRYSIIVMGGIAAEAVEFGRADGGAGDEEALVRFLRSLNPRSNNSLPAWTPELIRNQARWAATQAVLLLKEYQPCYNALVDALERGGNLGQCIVAIEEEARRDGLGWLHRPLGKVLEEGEYGKWIPIEDEGSEYTNVSFGIEFNGSNGETLEAVGSSPVSYTETKEINGVPTYGEDPITSTEEFLLQYRNDKEKKLASIEKKLEELDHKTNND